MEFNTQNSSGMMNGMPPITQPEKKVGPIVGALVIVLILIIAALYFFGQKLNTNTTVPPVKESPVSENSANVSSSTEVQSIQADLDAQLKDIDYSF